jgi:hypothetical protein
MYRPLDPRSRRLLSALTRADRERWQRQLECVDLARDQVLHEPGLAPSHVHFPATAKAGVCNRHHTLDRLL